MTTPPSQTPEPHRARQIAESFGVDAGRYDRARPPYPEALIERIVAASPGKDVLDVGCGTGIEARQFRAAGCTVLGVEPDERMAEYARRDGFDVEVSTFEDWEPAGRTFDAVVAGQSWHWVDPVVGATQAARVLRPGGRLALFWHVFDPPAEAQRAFVAAYRRVVPDAPFFQAVEGRSALDVYQAIVDKVAGGIREAGGFGEPERWQYDWERPYTRDEWLDLLPTQGTLTRLDAGQVAEVLAAVGDRIDELGGGITVRYHTVAVTASR
jgi:SAM-dependent methyltransferase